MTIPERYDKLLTGVIAGFVLPLVILTLMFLFSKGNPGIKDWLNRISMAGVETQIITLAVFPNVLIFLLFNQFDMLRASKGVLGITIIWAVLVFLIKFLI